MRGTVKLFDGMGNYGFIEPAEAGKGDHFVHKSDIKSGSPEEGDIVEFDHIEGEKGPRATNVRKLE